MGKTPTLDKEQLYRLFSEGKTDTEISKLVQKVPSTIAYHRKQWVKAGYPGLARPLKSEAEATADESASESPAAEAPQEGGERAIQWVESRPRRRRLEVGEWYEGAVAVIGTNWVLVDLVELADDTGRSPRGILHQNKTAGYQNPVLLYRTEELLQVQVIDKKFNPAKQRMDIYLSTLTEDEKAAGDEGAGSRESASHESTGESAQASQSAAGGSGDGHLCDTCLKQRICPLVELLTRAIERADIGEKYNHIHIKLRPLQVETCGEYVPEGVERA